MEHSPSSVLQKISCLYEEVVTAAQNKNINFQTIMKLYWKFSSFIFHSLPEITTIGMMAQCSVQLINCISNYVARFSILETQHMKNIKEIVYIILNISDLEIFRNKYIKCMLASMLVEITKSDMQIWFATYLIKNFNQVLYSLGNESHFENVEELIPQLQLLIATLFTYGDYNYQTNVVELMLLVCSDSDLNKYAKQIFHGFQNFAHNICLISKSHLHQSIREFLNLVNSNLQNVLSVECNRLMYDDVDVCPPKDSDGSELLLWTDFNIGSAAISILYSGDVLKSGRAAIPSDSNDLIIIRFADIISIQIFRTYYPEESYSIGSTIVINVCTSLGTANTVPKQLKLLILDCPELMQLKITLKTKFGGILRDLSSSNGAETFGGVRACPKFTTFAFPTFTHMGAAVSSAPHNTLIPADHTTGQISMKKGESSCQSISVNVAYENNQGLLSPISRVPYKAIDTAASISLSNSSPEIIESSQCPNQQLSIIYTSNNSTDNKKDNCVTRLNTTPQVLVNRTKLLKSPTIYTKKRRSTRVVVNNAKEHFNTKTHNIESNEAKQLPKKLIFQQLERNTTLSISNHVPCDNVATTHLIDVNAPAKENSHAIKEGESLRKKLLTRNPLLEKNKVCTGMEYSSVAKSEFSSQNKYCDNNITEKEVTQKHVVIESSQLAGDVQVNKEKTSTISCGNKENIPNFANRLNIATRRTYTNTKKLPKITKDTTPVIGTDTLMNEPSKLQSIAKTTIMKECAGEPLNTPTKYTAVVVGFTEAKTNENEDVNLELGNNLNINQSNGPDDVRNSPEKKDNDNRLENVIQENTSNNRSLDGVDIIGNDSKTFGLEEHTKSITEVGSVDLPSDKTVLHIVNESLEELCVLFAENSNNLNSVEVKLDVGNDLDENNIESKEAKLLNSIGTPLNLVTTENLDNGSENMAAVKKWKLKGIKKSIDSADTRNVQPTAQTIHNKNKAWRPLILRPNSKSRDESKNLHSLVPADAVIDHQNQPLTELQNLSCPVANKSPKIIRIVKIIRKKESKENVQTHTLSPPLNHTKTIANLKLQACKKRRAKPENLNSPQVVPTITNDLNNSYAVLHDHLYLATENLKGNAESKEETMLDGTRFESGQFKALAQSHDATSKPDSYKKIINWTNIQHELISHNFENEHADKERDLELNNSHFDHLQTDHSSLTSLKLCELESSKKNNKDVTKEKNDYLEDKPEELSNKPHKVMKKPITRFRRLYNVIDMTDSSGDLATCCDQNTEQKNQEGKEEQNETLSNKLIEENGSSIKDKSLSSPKSCEIELTKQNIKDVTQEKTNYLEDKSEKSSNKRHKDMKKLNAYFRRLYNVIDLEDSSGDLATCCNRNTEQMNQAGKEDHDGREQNEALTTKLIVEENVSIVKDKSVTSQKSCEFESSKQNNIHVTKEKNKEDKSEESLKKRHKVIKKPIARFRRLYNVIDLTDSSDDFATCCDQNTEQKNQEGKEDHDGKEQNETLSTKLIVEENDSIVKDKSLTSLKSNEPESSKQNIKDLTKEENSYLEDKSEEPSKKRHKVIKKPITRFRRLYNVIDLTDSSDDLATCCDQNTEPKIQEEKEDHDGREQNETLTTKLIVEENVSIVKDKSLSSLKSSELESSKQNNEDVTKEKNSYLGEESSTTRNKVMKKPITRLRRFNLTDSFADLEACSNQNTEQKNQEGKEDHDGREQTETLTTKLIVEENDSIVKDKSLISLKSSELESSKQNNEDVTKETKSYMEDKSEEPSKKRHKVIKKPIRRFRRLHNVIDLTDSSDDLASCCDQNTEQKNQEGKEDHDGREQNETLTTKLIVEENDSLVKDKSVTSQTSSELESSKQNNEDVTKETNCCMEDKFEERSKKRHKVIKKPIRRFRRLYNVIDLTDSSDDLAPYCDQNTEHKNQEGKEYHDSREQNETVSTKLVVEENCSIVKDKSLTSLKLSELESSKKNNDDVTKEKNKEDKSEESSKKRHEVMKKPITQFRRFNLTDSFADLEACSDQNTEQKNQKEKEEHVGREQIEILSTPLILEENDSIVKDKSLTSLKSCELESNDKKATREKSSCFEDKSESLKQRKKIRKPRTSFRKLYNINDLSHLNSSPDVDQNQESKDLPDSEQRFFNKIEEVQCQNVKSKKRRCKSVENQTKKRKLLKEPKEIHEKMIGSVQNSCINFEHVGIPEKNYSCSLLISTLQQTLAKNSRIITDQNIPNKNGRKNTRFARSKKANSGNKPSKGKYAKLETEVEPKEKYTKRNNKKLKSQQLPEKERLAHINMERDKFDSFAEESLDRCVIEKALENLINYGKEQQIDSTDVPVKGRRMNNKELDVVPEGTWLFSAAHTSEGIDTEEVYYSVSPVVTPTSTGNLNESVQTLAVKVDLKSRLNNVLCNMQRQIRILKGIMAELDVVDV